MGKLRLGLIVSLAAEPEPALDRLVNLGLPTCQIDNWNPDMLVPDLALRLKKAAAVRQIEITTLWAGFRGRAVWDFVDGPKTIGFVPSETRAERVVAFRRASEFARILDVPSVTTHAVFIPENLNDSEYPAIVAVVKELARHCRSNGQSLCFETGQETPTTLLRLFEDVGEPNLGVNFDPANLLMYGRANPLDALDIIGQYVKGVHAKDGEYPTNGRELGVEKPLGEGRVNFPALVAKLKALGYSGALTIEREVAGPEQVAGIKQAIDLLTPLL